jgi:hypothetical protein
MAGGLPGDALRGPTKPGDQGGFFWCIRDPLKFNSEGDVYVLVLELVFWPNAPQTVATETVHSD